MVRAKTSKKDDDLRTGEIRKAASESLLEWVAKNGAEVSRDPGGSLVVGEIMLYAEGGTYALRVLCYHADLHVTR